MVFFFLFPPLTCSSSFILGGSVTALQSSPPASRQGYAEKPFPFLFYFVDGSAGYTNCINLLFNGFPCFSFGLIGNIVGKLALQDAFICLHVLCNYCQLSGSKIRFPFSFFGTVSGMLFWIHVYTDTEKCRPSLPSQCFNHRHTACIALNFPPKPVYSNSYITT